MNKKTGKKLWRWVAGVLFLFFLSSLIVFGVSGGKWDVAGTIGDSFGAVNALFSGLAFVGLIYTILLQTDQIEQNSEQLKQNAEAIKMQATQIKMQRQDLELQREELKLTREELAKSADAQVEAAELAKTTARLSAHSSLLKHYSKFTLKYLEGNPRALDGLLKYTGTDPKVSEAKRYLELTNQEEIHIGRILQSMYEDQRLGR